MSDTDFTFEIKADASSALQAEVKVEDGLARIEVKAGSATAKLSDGMKEAAKAGHEAGNALDSVAERLEAIVALAGIGLGVHELAELSDEYTTVSNRLRVVTTDQANLNGLMDATFAIAQETRTSWEDVVSTYQRLANVTKSLGLSQQDVLNLVKEMGEASKISGASQRESAMSMAELTHAFATGTLQGREFRVLMRDTPQLMAELRIASGKTTGEFAEMGKHGKITAQNIIEWFGKAREEIESKFGKTIPTIADQMTRLHNAAAQFFGSSGLLSGVGPMIEFIANHFQTFGKIIVGVVEALGGLFLIEKIISLVKLLTAAIAANPLGALLVALTVGISLLRQFGDEIGIGGDSIAKMSDVLAVLWSYIVRLKDAVVDFLANAWSALTSAFSNGLSTNGVELSLKNVLLFIASFVDAAIGLFKFLGDSIVTVFGGIGAMIAKGFEIVLNGIIDGINKLSSAANKVSDLFLGKAMITDPRMAKALSMPDGKAKDDLMDEIKSDSGGPHFGKIGHVDFGMGDMSDLSGGFINKFKSDWKNDVEGTNTVKSMVDNFFAAVEQHAKDRIANASPGPGSMVSAQRGTPDPRMPTDAEIKALEKLKKELEHVMEQSNPVTEAQLKLAHAEDVVDRSIKAGLISWSQGHDAIVAYTNKLNDALHPFDAIVTKIMQQTAAYKDNKEEQLQAVEMEKLQNQAKKAGIDLTESQIAQLEHMVKFQRDRQQLMQAEQKMLDATIGPQRTYTLDMAALNDLLDKSKITTAQYALEVEKVKDAFAKATLGSRDFAYGVGKGLRDIRDQVLDVGTQVTKVMTSAFNGINDLIAQTVVKGSADWKKFVDSITTDMIKLLLQQAEGALIKLIFDVPTAASAGAAQGVAASSTLLAAAPAIGAAIGTAAAIAISTGTSATGLGKGLLSGLGGFATGGQFTVGGAGSGDSQLVAFRATPGERVTVETQQQMAASRRAGQRGSKPVVNVRYNPNELLSALDSSDGETVTMAHIKRNLPALRSWLGRL